MAWNPSPKVADARDIAKRWGSQQVIIVSLNRVNGTLEFASYGKTKQLCEEAGILGRAAYDAVLKKFVEIG